MSQMPQIKLESNYCTNVPELKVWAYVNSATYRMLADREATDAVIMFTLLRLTEELQDTINMLQTGYPRTDRERQEAMKRFLLENQQESTTKQILDTKA